ncbi:MAG: FtsW/RodA/SpoVE family cell cycle protein [Pseudarcicella sp.]|jgi:cell division protein FtsW|nr:FtsW/RodA/SpoVE family cell cycle protein [Pseudarcicella sp.]
MQAWLKKNLEGDYQLWIIVSLLCLTSVVVVFSATARYAVMQGNGVLTFLFKHSALLIAGLAAMWWIHRKDYHVLAGYSNFFVFLSILMLIYTYKYGVSINDTKRWLRIPLLGMTFMPSDLAKLALITNLSVMLAKRQNLEIFKIQELLPMILKIVAVCISISLTNVSTSVLLFVTCFLLMFFGRVPIRFLVLTLTAVVVMASLVVMLGVGNRIETARNRIYAFVETKKGTKKTESEKDADYQVERSYFAIAQGGMFGTGPGKSQQRYFLSQADSDFVYAIIIEEWGAIGGVCVLMLYLWFLYRGMKAVATSGRAFGGLLSAGLTFSLVIQAMVNMGVATGLGPVTGQPLPLLSMGGSSLIFTGLTIGIIISVSRDKAKAFN